MNERAAIDEDPNETRAHAVLRADADYRVAAWSLAPYMCPKFREASELDDGVLQLLSAPASGLLELENANFLRVYLFQVMIEWTELNLPGKSLFRQTRKDARALDVRLRPRMFVQWLREFLSR